MHVGYRMNSYTTPDYNMIVKIRFSIFFQYGIFITIILNEHCGKAKPDIDFFCIMLLFLHAFFPQKVSASIPHMANFKVAQFMSMTSLQIKDFFISRQIRITNGYGSYIKANNNNAKSLHGHSMNPAKFHALR